MTANDHRVSRLALAEPADPDTHTRRVDHAAVQRAARELLRAVGADVDADALVETPRRVADAYVELLTPKPFRANSFPNDDGYDEPRPLSTSSTRRSRGPARRSPSAW
jgi:GTP cyclohydrolase IA